MTTAAPGQYCFYRPDGTQIWAKPVTVSPGDDYLRDFNAQHGITPTAETPVPHWDGRHPDYPLIMDILLNTDGLLRDPTPTTT